MGVQEKVEHQTRTRIMVSMNRTINLGNYENIKLEVGLNTDALAEDETTIAETFKYAEEVCKERLVGLIEEFQGQTKPMPRGKK